MKKFNPFHPFLFAILLVSSSFFISAPTKAQVFDQVNSGVNCQDYAEVKKSADEPANLFVEMNDGTIRTFTTLKMVTGIMMTPHLVGDGKYLINGNDIKAYRDNNHYAVSQKTFESGHRSYLAVEILPGFVERVTAGKITIYDKKYFNGYRKADELFLQAGTEGPILPYSASLVNDLVKDDPEALKFFNSKKSKLPLLKKLQLTADIVNNNASLVSKN